MPLAPRQAFSRKMMQTVKSNGVLSFLCLVIQAYGGLPARIINNLRAIVAVSQVSAEHFRPLLGTYATTLDLS